MPQDPRPMVFALLDSITSRGKLVETVNFKVAAEKERRFLELVEQLSAQSRQNRGLLRFDLHRLLPASEPPEYLLYEVWTDQDGLRQQWQSDFLKTFQLKLTSEKLLIAPPDLRFYAF
jgi:quinol monooxygenase YgiN